MAQAAPTIMDIDTTIEMVKVDLAMPTTMLTPPTSRRNSPADLMPYRRHALNALASWERVFSLREGSSVILDGESLTIADLVAVAKYGVHVALDEDDKLLKTINDSVDVLARHLEKGEMVYGVNTGFGGSADVRTNHLASLQKGLVQHQNSAILRPSDTTNSASLIMAASDIQSAAMPTSWARGLMLARLNSIIRGHSAVSLRVIEAIVAFLQKQITPVIPKRGSISASGDLVPLSYLAAALQGNHDVFVYMRDSSKNMRVVSADEALRSVEMTPVVLGAKEGLGLLNGTAASASVASLALYECNQLILLSQILTAMGVEAMKGSAGSFHPFIAAIRPHRGQIEAAANVLSFLSGSRLAQDMEDVKNLDAEGLAQDRYALRTASQWLGPQLEDLLLATEQVSCELNSTTDNPLVDIGGNHVRHGGNFQAVSVSSAMEKSRLAMQMMAKLLFAQTTEIINPAMSRGLPPNLCSDDPSVSFTAKGIDITMAAYYSEIAFLSNPVSTHVQSAEMHNQSVNSLALISSRYTMKVVDIASQMCANQLIMACQALDLRVLQQRFLESARPVTANLIENMLSKNGFKTHKDVAINLVHPVWNSLVKQWDATSTLDLQERAQRTAESAVATLLHRIGTGATVKTSACELLNATEHLTGGLAETLCALYDTHRKEMFGKHNEITPSYLGRGTAEMYNYVRVELGIPLHRGLVDDPTYVLLDGQQASFRPKERKTIGSLISEVYEAIRSGAIHEPTVRAVKKSML